MAREPATRLAYSTEHAVDQPDKPRPRSARAQEPAGSKGGIRLRLDRRASDRVVTVVTGLPGTGAEIAALGKALKSACGTGGTVKNGTVELQGDHRIAVEAALLARGLGSKRSGG